MAKMSLKEWINSKQKAKGLSTKEAKAGASKYKSISAAKKAGSLYYTNKDGKTMIAATAEDLKVTRPKAKPKPLRPRKRPDTVTRANPLMGDMSVAEFKELKAANVEVKADEARRRAKKVAEAKAALKAMRPDPSSKTNAARKKPMAKKKVAPITFKMWQGMSRAERKSNDLPVSIIGGQLGFNRFKTGITGKEYDSKGNIVK
tara:strand:+ start:402 stop:1010 length:609 start_codon:yes stop_codon:yes gene_type:complete